MRRRRCWRWAWLPPKRQELGGIHVVEHAGEVDVEAARVVVGVAEESVGADVVHPHAAALEASFGHDALHGGAGDEEFLEHAAVELGELVAEAVGAGFVVVGLALLGEGAEAADDGLDELAYEVVGEGPASAFLGQFGLCVAAGARVAPLPSVGEALAPCALGTLSRGGEPGVACAQQAGLPCVVRSYHSRVKCQGLCRVVIRQGCRARPRGRQRPWLRPRCRRLRKGRPSAAVRG